MVMYMWLHECTVMSRSAEVVSRWTVILCTPVLNFANQGEARSELSSSSVARHLAGVSSIFSQYCNTPSMHISLSRPKLCPTLLHIGYTLSGTRPCPV